MPSISVVVPLYNKENHINRCLDSIFNQTYQDFEIIVVNDGSTDNSEKRVHDYSDSRLRLINKQNGGEASARNCGIENSQTDTIAFLDSDDQWLPGFLEKIIYLKNKYPEAKVYSTAVYHNNGSRFTYPTINKMYPKKWDGIIQGKEIFQIGFPFNSSSIAINRQTLDQYGYFDENLKIGTDSDMWFRLILLVPFAHSHDYLSEVFLDSQNRTNYEATPTDISVIIQKSFNEATNFNAKITEDLREIIDQEIVMSKYFFICSYVPREQRWAKVLPLITDKNLLRLTYKTKRISPNEKYLAYIRMLYWLAIDLFQKVKQ